MDQVYKNHSEEDFLEDISTLIEKLTLRGKSHFSDSDIELLRHIKFYLYDQILKKNAEDEDDDLSL